MKEGWTIKPILDICDVYQPQTISTSKLIANAPYDVFGANGCIGKYNQYNHEEDEVLLTCRGATCGNINRSTPKAWINGNAMVIHPKSNELSKDFLTFLLKAIDYSHIITGTAQPQITRTSLSAVQLPIPTPTAQQQIVSFLDAQFAKIDAIKANAEKQLQEAKALFQNALKDLLDSKEGWEHLKLNEIAEYYNGLTYKPSDVAKSGTLVLRSSNIQNNHLYLEDNVFVSINVSDKLRVHKGDIIMCSRNGSKSLIGKVALIPKEYENFTFGTFMMIIKSNINSFLYFYFLSDNFKRQIWKGEANMINQITRYMLDEVVVDFPKDDKELQSIVEKLNNLYFKIQSLQSNYSQTITLCEDLKKSLLKDIFS